MTRNRDSQVRSSPSSSSVSSPLLFFDLLRDFDASGRRAVDAEPSKRFGLCSLSTGDLTKIVVLGTIFESDSLER